MLQLFVAWIGSAHAESPTVLKVWHAYRDAEADVLESILQDYDKHTPKSLKFTRSLRCVREQTRVCNTPKQWTRCVHLCP